MRVEKTAFRADQPRSPCGRLTSPTCLTSLQINPRAELEVAGGSQAGAVAWWDTRLAGLAARRLNISLYKFYLAKYQPTNTQCLAEYLEAS